MPPPSFVISGLKTYTEIMPINNIGYGYLVDKTLVGYDIPLYQDKEGLSNMSDLKDKITVGIDVGCYKYRVAIADSAGHIIEEFNIDYDHLGFAHLLYKLYCYEKDFDSTMVDPINAFFRLQRILKSIII